MASERCRHRHPKGLGVERDCVYCLHAEIERLTRERDEAKALCRDLKRGWDESVAAGQEGLRLLAEAVRERDEARGEVTQTRGLYVETMNALADIRAERDEARAEAEHLRAGVEAYRKRGWWQGDCPGRDRVLAWERLDAERSKSDA